jgi:UDP-N-acetyl-D-glucosamine dehydrogenase
MAATSALASVFQAGRRSVYESTTHLGTTRDRVKPVLDESGRVAVEDFRLGFSPERVDPGREGQSLRTTPKVTGFTPAGGYRAERIYAAVCDSVVRVTTLEVAEMSKLLESIFRPVNSALVNEMAALADRMDIDIWEVIDAAATKPFGLMRFDPGPGIGAHRRPVDPFYLGRRAREVDLTTELIEPAGKVSHCTPYQCVERIERALNDLHLPVRDSRICLLGVTYESGGGDVPESPALKIGRRLQSLGAQVSYHDPHVAELPSLGLRNRPLDEALSDCDRAVIVTAHREVDHAAIAARASVPRGVIRAARATARPAVRATGRAQPSPPRIKEPAPAGGEPLAA